MKNKFLSCLCLFCPIFPWDVYSVKSHCLKHITLNLCHCVRSKGSGSSLHLYTLIIYTPRGFSSRVTFISIVWYIQFFFSSQGDIFSGLNDGILSRAEVLAAADIQKHQQSHAHSQMQQQLKHDVMYHSMGGPPQRPLQVSWRFILKFLRELFFLFFLNWYCLLAVQNF